MVGHRAALRRFRKPFAVLAVILAVIAPKIGGDGWESNPPRTPQQRPANGFEDPWGRVEFRTGLEGP
jgi:hypothetical protein